MLSVHISPDPVLNTVCVACDIAHDKSLSRLSKQMAHLMYSCNGIGIAAPQVGVSKRLIVVDCDIESKERNPLILINPTIEKTWGEDVFYDEGCLSVPGISIAISRPSCVKVRYFDLNATLWELDADGLLARCLQHEIDHLDGITMLERCDPEAHAKALVEYEQALIAGAKPGDVGEKPRT